jgi:hypothetical protein
MGYEVCVSGVLFFRRRAIRFGRALAFCVLDSASPKYLIEIVLCMRWHETVQHLMFEQPRQI